MNAHLPNDSSVSQVIDGGKILYREHGDSALRGYGPPSDLGGQIDVLPGCCRGGKQKLIDMTSARRVINLDLVVRSLEARNGRTGVRWRSFCFLGQIGATPLHIVGGRQLQNVTVYTLDVDPQLLRARHDKRIDVISRTRGNAVG